MLLFSTSLRATGRLLCCSKTSPTLSTPRSTSSAARPGVISEGEREQRLLRAAVLGLPNAGKTTLVNQLLGRKLFAVSPKRHTTTRSIMGVFTEGESQIILMDTPGVIPYQLGRKLGAPKSFLTGPQRSLMEAELVLVVVDASDKRKREKLDEELMKTLTKCSHIPAILLLNKVDAVRQKHILLSITDSIAAAANEWTLKQRRRESDDSMMKTKVNSNGSSSGVDVYSGPASERETCTVAVESFREVFMVSALTGDGVADLREYLVSCSRPGKWEFSVTEHTDQTEMALVEDIVREKLFLHLQQEIPYVVRQSNVVWEKEGDTQIIYQNLTCRSSNQASIVIGPGGRTVQTITAEAKTDIEALLGCPVDLTLNVRSQK